MDQQNNNQNPPVSSPSSPPLQQQQQSPSANHQTYHQQQLLHQQQIQRGGGLQRLTADLAGLQMDDDLALMPRIPQPHFSKLKTARSGQPLARIAKTTVIYQKSLRIPPPTAALVEPPTQQTDQANKLPADQGVAASPQQSPMAKRVGGYEDQMMAKQNSEGQPNEIDPTRDAQETLEDAQSLKHFKIIALVGTGNYARVYKAMSSRGKELAIKSINLTKTSENYRKKFLPRELTILKKVNHNNICKIREILQVADRIFIVMQFCSRGTIADLLHRNGPFSEPVARFLFHQVLEAVVYLHSIDLTHRDLKVENILLDQDFTPKLTDFSYSCYIIELTNSRSSASKYANLKQAGASSSPQQANAAAMGRSIKLNETFCGTLPYLSPEMIRQCPYDPRKTDVWSLGVCLYVMLNDRLPFPFNDIKQMIRKQMARDFKFRANVEFSETVKEMVGLMLEPDYLKRPRSKEVLKHAWFNGSREKPAG